MHCMTEVFIIESFMHRVTDIIYQRISGLLLLMRASYVSWRKIIHMTLYCGLLSWHFHGFHVLKIFRQKSTKLCV